MEKINVAELLKDCPEGMEFDCLLCHNPIALEGVIGDEVTYPIKAVGKDGFHHVFTSYGASYNHADAKCVIFPKGKTTWEGFIPPCQFKDGDVVATDSGRWVGIIKNKYDFEYYTVHCAIDYTFNDIFYKCGEYCFSRLATEEEKEKLFQAIKENGYRWNPDNKILEKLIQPKFKVGDRIRHKENGNIFKIDEIDMSDSNYCCGLNYIWVADQDKFELVPDKFDITALKPFDKVLVRDSYKQIWAADFLAIILKYHSKDMHLLVLGVVGINVSPTSIMNIF